jgi:hypothetical protein
VKTALDFVDQVPIRYEGSVQGPYSEELDEPVEAAATTLVEGVAATATAAANELDEESALMAELESAELDMPAEELDSPDDELYKLDAKLDKPDDELTRPATTA